MRVLWEQLAETKQAEGDVAGAMAAAQHSLDDLPSNADGWLLQGTLLVRQEKYEDAAAAFRRVSALDHQAFWARHDLAVCLEKTGRRDEAIVEFKQALAMEPGYSTAWLGLGQLYEEMGRTNDANQCYDAALTHRMKRADVLTTLARFCASRQWFDQANTNFAAAIELNPLDPGLRVEAGHVLSLLGRHEDCRATIPAGHRA